MKWQWAYQNDLRSCSFLRKDFQVSGVYIIKNLVGQILYIGMSKSNVYKTLYRHFQNWDSAREQKAVYNKHMLVRIIKCSPQQSTRLEKYLILKLNPNDNIKKYNKYKVEEVPF